MKLSNFTTVEQLAAAVRTLLETDMANNHGWISSAWQKDPIRLGVSDTYREEVDDTNLSSGTNTLDGTAVPAGEIWVIENIAAYYSGTVSSVRLIVHIRVGGVADYEIDEFDSITSSKYYGLQGSWTLKEGDLIRLEIRNATAGDDGLLRIVGRKVDIDQ